MIIAMIMAMWMHKCSLETVKLVEYVLFPGLCLAHFERLSPHFSAMASFDSCDAHQAGTKWSNYCREFSKFEALVKRMEHVYAKRVILMFSRFSLYPELLFGEAVFLSTCNQRSTSKSNQRTKQIQGMRQPCARKKQKRLQLNPEI